MADFSRGALSQRVGPGISFGNSAFLSPSVQAPNPTSANLRDLLTLSKGHIPGVSYEGAAPLGDHAACPQPYNPNLALFCPQGMGQISDIGDFNLKRLGEGEFTERTIDNMHRAVLKAKTDAKWRGMMEEIRQLYRRQGLVGWKDYLGEMRAMDDWYRGLHFIDYVRDPHQVEMVVAPMLTYQKGVGDCDDSSVLMAASMGVLGAAHRFRTYKADPRRPDEWSHVVSQIAVPGYGWVNDDLTLTGLPFGFEPEGFEYKDWPEPRY
jgi:Transglutaminase-like superfamily